MYNPLLTAFVCAADCGSFTKAAEKLYLSPTAVMKQINTLESHLQLQLISRTNQGIRLTPAGESIYADAKFLFDYSARAVRFRKMAAALPLSPAGNLPEMRSGAHRASSGIQRTAHYL